MQRKIAIVVVALAIVGAGVYFWMRTSNTPATQTTPNNSSAETSNDADSPATETQTVSATITYSDSGFAPETVTVKSGQTIAIKNESSTDVQFDSDPHPIHTTNEELNVEIIEPGQVKTFTVTKSGTFGYHNHLNASQTGTIVIE